MPGAYSAVVQRDGDVGLPCFFRGGMRGKVYEMTDDDVVFPAKTLRSLIHLRDDRIKSIVQKDFELKQEMWRGN